MFIMVPIMRTLSLMNCFLWNIFNRNGALLAPDERHSKLKMRYSSSPTSMPWAIITGSTDGIGYEFAKKLAKLNFNLVMIGRNEDKLKNCSTTIKKEINCNAKIIEICCDAKDFTEMDERIAMIVERTSKIDISILINNVGVGQGGRKKLEYLDSSSIKDCIIVNCLFPTLLTKALLPKLKLHIGPKLIINMSSVAALVMNPLSSVYCATKAFNRQFSIALSSEYRENGIDSLAVMPGFVSTPMTGMKPSMLCCKGSECVDAVFDWIIDHSSMGLNDILEVIPHWKHQIMYYTLMFLATMIPTFWRAKVIYAIVHEFRKKNK